MIDLRSDTATRPTAAMRAAIAGAAVGDEQRREDPSVTALQERAAALLGHEAALFLPTATMANQIALRLHGRPGDLLVADQRSHIVLYEFGGAAIHAGLMTVPVDGDRGRIPIEALLGATEPGARRGAPRVVLTVEDTHNASGGRCQPPAHVAALLDAARARGVRTHLDGARLMNAAVAQGLPAARLAGGFDTVTLCLSKGLGCPLGAILAGSSELMARAWDEKHLFGGAMRQAGIVAAAGLHALAHHVERLAEDHVRARTLATAWVEAGLPVDLAQVETNFVQVRVGELGLTSSTAIERLAAAGVGLSAAADPGVLRAVTHLDVTDEDVERAAALVPAALGVAVRV
ncbi:MAG: low specificity L-threonine aldolase [Thermoleophilia bacterium]|nr:low specificity L-threonine aldolase [Thermoleophilia bacterium]